MVNGLISTGLNWDDINNLYKNNNKKLVEDMIEIGLISSNIPICKKIEKHSKNKNRNMTADYKNWYWICRDKKCRTTISFNHNNSFMRNMKKDPLIIIRAIYMWVNEFKQDQISYECKIDPHTVSQWNIYWREILTIANDNEPKLKGNVEIDETMISNRKNYKGKRQRTEGPIWIQTCASVTIYDDQSRKINLTKAMITHDRTKETMEENLLNMIDNNSNIQSDSFSSYNGLNKIFNSHNKVNHSKEFVNINEKNEKIHTNSIEGFHGCIKRKARSLRLLNGKCNDKEIIGDKIQELVWRYNYGKNPEERFPLFMKLLAKVYSVDNMFS